MNRFITLEFGNAVMNEHAINQWFDYWSHQLSKESSGRGTSMKLRAVEKIRDYALIGREQHEATDRQVTRKTLDRLRQLTEQLERETGITEPPSNSDADTKAEG